MQLQGHLLVEMLFVGWARCLWAGRAACWWARCLRAGATPHQQVTLLLPSDSVKGGSFCSYRVICRGEERGRAGESREEERGEGQGERGSGSGE